MVSFESRFPEARWMTERRGVPEAFIQWKGTDVCMDLDCLACGAHLHIDGMFGHYVRCACGSVMQMKAHIEYRLLPDGAEPHVPPLSDSEAST